MRVRSRAAARESAMEQAVMIIKVEAELARLLTQIGGSVEIFYEARNKDQEWYVGVVTHGINGNPSDEGMPLHGHFPTLIEGLEWVRDHPSRHAERES